MRFLLLLAVGVCAVGCGESTKSAAESNGTTKVEAGATRPLRKCTSVSYGYRACSTFFTLDRHSAIYRRDGQGWVEVAGPLPHAGWWRRVLPSPDGQTLLAQWSGECEVQSTYLLSVADGRPRPVFARHVSSALGWSADGRARVVLAEPVYALRTRAKFRPGTYRIDPRTMAVELERVVARKNGC